MRKPLMTQWIVCLTKFPMMVPIIDCFEKLMTEFENSIITYDYYKVDLEVPENIHLKNLNDPSHIWEGYMFNLNGNSLNGFYFNNLINNAKDEIISNLKIPIDPKHQVIYLKKVDDFSSKIDESIIKKNGNWTHIEAKYEGFNYDELPDYEKDSLSNSLKELKTTFRNLIVFVNSYRENLEPLVQRSRREETITPNPQLDLREDFTPDIVTRSFRWKRIKEFQRDMIVLFELMTNDQNRIIPKETDFRTFCYAFSGKPLNSSLRIKWQITGKNNLTSKSSLFHFISRLEDFKLIENKEWSRNNMPLYQKISIIFSDKDDNMFTIDGLKSSKSQGLGSNCAMQPEIDNIVKRLANLNTDKLTE